MQVREKHLAYAEDAELRQTLRNQVAAIEEQDLWAGLNEQTCLRLRHRKLGPRGSEERGRDCLRGRRRECKERRGQERGFPKKIH